MAIPVRLALYLLRPICHFGDSPSCLSRKILRSNSRQDAYVFETSNHVANHSLYAKAKLFDAFDLKNDTTSDGPILMFGPEVTVGG